jgi:hypothetical protein
MNSSEREDFEVHLAQLFGAYDKPLTDSKREGYWTGLQKMTLVAFSRVVEHAVGPDGPAQVPNTKDIWGLYRKLRSRAATSSTPAAEKVVSVDQFTAEGNLALMKFLVECAQAASPQALPLLVAEKNRIAAQYQQMAAVGDPATAGEKWLVYQAAFRRVYAPASFDDVEGWRRQFCRERGLDFVPRVRTAAAQRAA